MTKLIVFDTTLRDGELTHGVSFSPADKLAIASLLAASGVDVIDQPRSMYLAELALDMSERVLKPGGDALIKVFQGAGFQELVQSARDKFTRVRLVKPLASRSRSPEIYLLAMQYRLV